MSQGSAPVDPDTLRRYADLVVGFGANVQPGQILELASDLGKEEMTRAIAASAYRHGARFVDANYFDPHVKRARLEHADTETLPFVPSWYGERVLALGEQRCAIVALAGPAAPGLYNDLDPTRVGLDRLPAVKESMQVINDLTVNWCVAPCPTAAWAALVYPELEEADALERLWERVLHICRLDEDDPVAAWRKRARALGETAARLTALRFDALRFSGPGTELTVGLLPSSTWQGGLDSTADGIEHLANLPTEETFTAPDPARVDGIVRATRPLVVADTVISGLVVRFESGRAVEIEAETGAELLRTRCAHDEGAARLGEVSLVDREGRIGPLDTVFYDTLLDENAASHLALGSAYEDCVEPADVERLNRSDLHIDFMIGSNDVDVSGITAAGELVPVLRRGTWQI